MSDCLSFPNFAKTLRHANYIQINANLTEICTLHSLTLIIQELVITACKFTSVGIFGNCWLGTPFLID